MDESLRREQTNTRTTGMERMNERRDGVRNPNKKKKNTDKNKRGLEPNQRGDRGCGGDRRGRGR